MEGGRERSQHGRKEGRGKKVMVVGRRRDAHLAQLSLSSLVKSRSGQGEAGTNREPLIGKRGGLDEGTPALAAYVNFRIRSDDGRPRPVSGVAGVGFLDR